MTIATEKHCNYSILQFTKIISLYHKIIICLKLIHNIYLSIFERTAFFLYSIFDKRLKINNSQFTLTIPELYKKISKC